MGSPDIGPLIGLAVDVMLLTMFNSWYKRINREADEIKRAPQVKLGQELITDLKSSESGCLAYACIEGEVRPTNQTLFSQHIEGHSGVMKYNSMVEHKSKRVQGFWTDVKNTIQDKVQSVPFILRRLLSQENEPEIHVLEATEAKFLTDDLSITYDHFEPTNASFLSKGLDRMFGESTKGYHETEKMLLTNTMLLGIGEIGLVDEKLQLRPPRSGAMYILTKMTKEEVIKKLEQKSKWVKAFFIGTGIVGVGLFLYILRKHYKQWRHNAAREEFLSEMRERRQELHGRRTQPNDDRENETYESNSCVVCLSNPREIVLLECGHICLCAECVLQLPEPMSCPVCRQPVDRYLSTYNP